MTPALRDLERVRAEARKRGWLVIEFVTRLALGEIELASGKQASARSRLQALAREAESKGLGLIARRAAAGR